MEADRIRGLLSKMRLCDRVALCGGEDFLPALARPQLERTELGECVMPYGASSPLPLALGCTFSRELCREVARAEKARAGEKRIALAGAVPAGLIRDPMRPSAGGLFADDPYLVSQIVGCFTDGDGLGFALSDCLGQERRACRRTDMRALFELYLRPLIENGKNAAALLLDGGALNGERVSSSRSVFDLLTKFLKTDAFVVTPWGEGEAELKTGSYLLGADRAQKAAILRSIENGALPDARLDRCAGRALSLAVNTHEFYRSYKVAPNAGLPDISTASSVLLKNSGVLPYDGNIAYFGEAKEFADGKKFGVLPFTDAAKKQGEFNVFLIGGYERSGIPETVVNAVMTSVRRGKPTVAVLVGCCAAPLGEIKKAGALMFCPSCPNVADIDRILRGEAPGGRLPFCWCARREDYPANSRTAATRGDFRYESLYNGHLLFDSFDMPVDFPFGHGLGYTEFEINSLRAATDGSRVHLSAEVKNVGAREGEAVVEVFADKAGGVYGLNKRFIGFERVRLAAGQSKTVNMEVDLAAIAPYDENSCRFVTLGGKYRLNVGLSSRDIRATAEVKIKGETAQIGLDKKSAPSYHDLSSPFAPAAPEIERLLGVPFIKKEDISLTAPISTKELKKRAAAAIKTAPRDVKVLMSARAEEISNNKNNR